MNTIQNLSRSDAAWTHQLGQAGTSQTSSLDIGTRLADGLDLPVVGKDLDQLIYSKGGGGGRIDCPEGTHPEITTKDRSVLVECKPDKPKPAEKVSPSQSPILQ
jgi:hypothetical protein